ncbi:hypothetical protein KFL_000940060 [Klebsormidium nitens]|uniref:Glutaredoxin domain-containing protein n=1 Tax=Klebsormidium nitens TaxID=105231 RepID=A0A1Y1HZF1_KLENI|nr:hypothetical protein KFL_000940060 [Klebsormidium nitens]|eukprot:GAQ81896.1 hypothetical protein KFL_000940060 [Klebsormidium nitens]
MKAALVILVLAGLLIAVPQEVGASSDEALQFVKQFIAEHPIAMFSKSYCPYCARAKQAFKALGPDAEPAVVELDGREDGYAIQDALGELVGRRSVPQVFIDGFHIGGSDDTVDAYQSGKLAKLVAKATGKAASAFNTK